MSSSSGEKSSVPVLGIESPAVGFRKMAVAPNGATVKAAYFSVVLVGLPVAGEGSATGPRR